MLAGSSPVWPCPFAACTWTCTWLQVVQRYVDPYERTTAMVITPTVVKEVRAQFGCNTLPGAALENEGGAGSANAHWEYRWFQVMVGGEPVCLFWTQKCGATLSRVVLWLCITAWSAGLWQEPSCVTSSATTSSSSEAHTCRGRSGGLHTHTHTETLFVYTQREKEPARWCADPEHCVSPACPCCCPRAS